jgi:hypothetical protein
MLDHVVGLGDAGVGRGLVAEQHEADIVGAASHTRGAPGAVACRDQLGGVGAWWRSRHHEDIVADQRTVLDQRRRGRNALPSRRFSPPGTGRSPHPEARQSAPVSTASTPGAAFARPVSIERIRAWAWGERSTQPNAVPGSTMSPT